MQAALFANAATTAAWDYEEEVRRLMEYFGVRDVNGTIVFPDGTIAVREESRWRPQPRADAPVVREART